MIHKFKVKTSAGSEMADITREVQGVVREAGLEEGLCHVFVPHTTCGLAINENADPDVKRDIIAKLEATIENGFDYRHSEGNSPAHIKAALMGSSLTVFVEDGGLQLGAWQGLYLCEYDGPRTREVWVKTVKG
jgi:secondary thiamine-phosphate synthase enzyme